ncbi:MAG: trehalose-6-phosphate synthase, partial [Burkholderiaceae bacterium]
MFRTLRLSLRFLLPLLAALFALAYLSMPLVDALTLRWFVRDLDIRSSLVARTLEEQLAELTTAKSTARIDGLLERAAADERLFALGVCDASNRLVRKTRHFPAAVDCAVRERVEPGTGFVLELPSGPLHVAVGDVRHNGEPVASLVMLHDMSFVQRRSADTRKYIVWLFTVMGLVVALITVAVAHLSWRGWVAGVRAMLRGEGVIRPFSQPRPELQPLVGDLRALLRDMQNERREHDATTLRWDPEALRRLLKDQFSGDEVILVSNREPYIHVRSGQGIQVQRPASGLVTAVEPVMRACSGTWIAHGG